MRQGPFVLLAVLVFSMVACSGSDDAATTATDTQTIDTTEATIPATTPTTTVPDTTVPVTSEAPESHADVFSFADDDLCEWVTQEEVAGFVAAAFDWDGTVTQSPPMHPLARQ